MLSRGFKYELVFTRLVSPPDSDNVTMLCKTGETTFADFFKSVSQLVRKEGGPNSASKQSELKVWDPGPALGP